VVESSGRRDNRRNAGRFTASWIRIPLVASVIDPAGTCIEWL
jgi:hypothetical protein